SSRRRHTRSTRDWSSDVCSSDLSQKLANPSPKTKQHIGCGISRPTITITRTRCNSKDLSRQHIVGWRLNSTDQCRVCQRLVCSDRFGSVFVIKHLCYLVFFRL